MLNLTRSCAELLLLLDQCSDDSLGVAARLLASGLGASAVRRARVLEQPTPVWEAAGENLLMRVAAPRVAYALVQPDNFVRSAGWDVQMLRPLAAHPSVLGVSGYVAHAFGAGSAELAKHYDVGGGRSTATRYVQAEARSTAASADAFYVRDTAARFHAPRCAQGARPRLL